MDPVPSWRQAFLIERGKMTEDRFAKIRDSISHFNNQSTIHMRNDTGVLEFAKFTRQELLAVECQKPKFQAPCQLYQRRKCVKKKNGVEWKMVSCVNYSGTGTGTLRSLLVHDDL